MHQHHSTVRLALGILALFVLGLCGYFLVSVFTGTDHAQAPTHEVSPFTQPTTKTDSSTTSPFNNALVPGLESSTPPPGR